LRANTFVALPTGSGKTFIAAAVILNFYNWFPSGQILFFAPTKPLVSQQKDAVGNMLNLADSEDIAKLSGEVSPKIRKHVYDGARIIFCTPDTYLNDIKTPSKRRADLSRAVLLVFDEAHNDRVSAMYGQIVRFFNNEELKIRVLALSATPSDSTAGL
jgi:ERCC4-related helicase